jgi:hypothetical protein
MTSTCFTPRLWLHQAADVWSLGSLGGQQQTLSDAGPETLAELQAPAALPGQQLV